MFKFLKDFVITPEEKAAREIARRKAVRLRGPQPALPVPTASQPLSAADALDAAREKLEERKRAPRTETPERAALIQNAVSVVRAKQMIFEGLTDEERARLILLAMRTFLHGDP